MGQNTTSQYVDAYALINGFYAAFGHEQPLGLRESVGRNSYYKGLTGMIVGWSGAVCNGNNPHQDTAAYFLSDPGQEGVAVLRDIADYDAATADIDFLSDYMGVFITSGEFEHVFFNMTYSVDYAPIMKDICNVDDWYTRGFVLGDLYSEI